MSKTVDKNNGRVILEVNCNNKAEARMALDMMKNVLDEYGINEPINRQVIVTNEGNANGDNMSFNKKEDYNGNTRE